LKTPLARYLKSRRQRLPRRNEVKAGEESLIISSEKFESRHLDSYEEILATMANVPPLARAVLVLMGWSN
jgi:hypothetical protein